MTGPVSLTPFRRAIRYLNPRNVLVFKRLFGGHEAILRSFLNALLPLPDDGQIVSLEDLPAEQVPELPLFKNTRLRFLKETGDVDTPEEATALEKEIASASPELKEAVTLAAEAGFTPGQLAAYDKCWDAIRSERTLIEGKTEEARAEGKAEGRAEGEAARLEKGRAAGDAVGLERGRELERSALIKKLVNKGMSEAKARALLEG